MLFSETISTQTGTDSRRLMAQATKKKLQNPFFAAKASMRNPL